MHCGTRVIVTSYPKNQQNMVGLVGTVIRDRNPHYIKVEFPHVPNKMHSNVLLFLPSELAEY